MADRIDLGDALAADPPPQEPVWVGPGDSDPLRVIGPGTTDGGRAEAGWFNAGWLVGDGPTMTPD